MKIRLCLMAGIFGIALITGVLESLSTPRGYDERKEKTTTETNERAGQ